MKTIKLINKPSYGHERLYPDCNTAETFAKHLGRTCFRRKDIEWLESLGYTVEIEQPLTPKENGHENQSPS